MDSAFVPSAISIPQITLLIPSGTQTVLDKWMWDCKLEITSSNLAKTGMSKDEATKLATELLMKEGYSYLPQTGKSPRPAASKAPLAKFRSQLR